MVFNRGNKLCNASSLIIPIIKNTKSFKYLEFTIGAKITLSVIP